MIFRWYDLSIVVDILRRNDYVLAEDLSMRLQLCIISSNIIEKFTSVIRHDVTYFLHFSQELSWSKINNRMEDLITNIFIIPSEFLLQSLFFCETIIF